MTKLTSDDIGTYPEVLSEGRFYQHFKKCRRASFGELKEALKWLETHSEFQIYTETEGDNNTYYMDKGFHYVNRTGYYVCVLDNRYTVMRYKPINKDDEKFIVSIREELI